MIQQGHSVDTVQEKKGPLLRRKGRGRKTEKSRSLRFFKSKARVHSVSQSRPVHNMPILVSQTNEKS